MVTADQYDEGRAAAALLAIADRDDHPDVPSLRAVVLGADPGTDRPAAIAAILAAWLAQVLRETGADPREFARQIVAESIADEAAQAAEDPP